MGFVVSGIFVVSMNKIALWIHVRVNDWTAERAIIASNERQMKIILSQFWDLAREDMITKISIVNHWHTISLVD